MRKRRGAESTVKLEPLWLTPSPDGGVQPPLECRGGTVTELEPDKSHTRRIWRSRHDLYCRRGVPALTLRQIDPFVRIRWGAWETNG